MFRANVRLLLWGVFGLWAAAACAADPWQNARVMPKSDQLTLRAGRGFTGNVYQIQWPATVEHIEGQWLWIADQGGYRVPPVAGWVSKDDVWNAGEAHAHYREVLQTTDAPWLHWLLGICLEQDRETETAQEEYARCLNVPWSRDKAALRVDGNAVQMAVQIHVNLLDAAVRLERLQAAAGESAEEAAVVADLLQSLSQSVERDGIRRPYVCFEQAEALRKAFDRKVAEDRKAILGTKSQIAQARIARANSERDGGAGEARDLFQRAQAAYQCSLAADPGYVCAGPHCWKGHMGKAELCLDRIAALEDEAWSLIAAGARSTAENGAREKAAPEKGAAEKIAPGKIAPGKIAAEKIAAEKSPTGQLDVATTPLDLKMLDDCLGHWQRSRPSAPPDATVQDQIHAVCVCLAEEIRMLHVAVAAFDAAVSATPDLIEAYRDRAAAYLALARCEATLAAIEEADRDEQPRLASLFPDEDLSPQKLDRALVDGRRQFNKMLGELPAVKATVAEVTAERKALSNTVQQMATGYVTAAFQCCGPDAPGKDNTKAATPFKSALQAMQGRVTELKANAAAAWEQLDQDERKAEQELSDVEQSLDGSYTILTKSPNLREARRSAETACRIGNLANTESLKILAAIFAAQCNFDRAEFYQKMATTYASDDERRQIYKTLNDYRQMGEMVLPKAKPYTAPSAPGQGKGAKAGGGGGADAGPADDAGPGD